MTTITICDRYDHATLEPSEPRIAWHPSAPGGDDLDTAEAFARELLSRVAEARQDYAEQMQRYRELGAVAFAGERSSKARHQYI
jgi:hypothetical protein